MNDTKREFCDACNTGNLNRVKAMLPECRKYIKTGLQSACYHGHLEVVAYLAEQADEDELERVLCYAAEGGQLEVVKYLVEEKRAIATRETLYLVCLYYEQRDRYLEVVKYLLNCDLNNVTITNDGLDCALESTAYDDHTRYDNSKLMKYLIEKGADSSRIGIYHIPRLLNMGINPKLLDDRAKPYIAKRLSMLRTLIETFRKIPANVIEYNILPFLPVEITEYNILPFLPSKLSS